MQNTDLVVGLEPSYSFDHLNIDRVKNRIRVSEEEWLGRNYRVRMLRSFAKGHSSSFILRPVYIGEARYVVCLTKWNRLLLEEATLLEHCSKGILDGRL